MQIVAIPTDRDFKMRNEVQVEVSFQKYNVYFKEMKKNKNIIELKCINAR